MKNSCAGRVKPIIVGGILFAIASQIILMGEVIVTMDIYMMPEYFPVWSTLMMPDMGPPPAIFYAISISVSYGLALLYSTVYGILQNAMDSRFADNLGYSSLWWNEP